MSYLITHRLRDRKIVLEVDLRGSDQGGAHEDAEGREAHRIVLFPCVWAARMLGERGAMIESDTDEEHGQAPT